jgi:hypothetical protein
MTADTNTVGAAATGVTAGRPKRQRPPVIATGLPAARPTTVAAAKPPSKSALVIKLLSRARGATASEIGEPTGWQPHSVRSYLTGLRKKGRSIVREQRKTGETAYRIDGAATVSSAEAAARASDAAAATVA